MEVDLEELPGSHRILIYIGPHNKNNPDNERNIDQLVGVAPIFTGPTPVTNKNRYLNFTVPLTAALVEKNVALRPEDTVPTLKEQLYWTVEKVITKFFQIHRLQLLKFTVTAGRHECPADPRLGFEVAQDLRNQLHQRIQLRRQEAPRQIRRANSLYSYSWQGWWPSA